MAITLVNGRLLSSRFRRAVSNDGARLLGGAAFVFGCRVAGAGLVFLTQLLLARWMGAEQLGIYVYAFSLCVLLTTVSGLGFPTAAFRFMTQAAGEGNSARLVGFFRRSRMLGLMTSALVCGAGCLVVFWPDGWVPDANRTTIAAALLAVPAFTLMRLYSGTAHAMSWFRLAFLPTLVLRPLLLLVVIVAIWAGGYVLSAAGVMVVHLGVMALLAAVQSRMVGGALELHHATNAPEYETALWLRTALPLLVTSLIAKNFLELNVIVVGLFLEVDQLAVFNVSLRLAFLIAFGIYAVDAMTLPRFSRDFGAGNKSELQLLLTRASRIKFCGALGGFALIALTGKWFLGAFGPEFVVGYHALVILCVSQLAVAALGPALQILNITGHQDYCLSVSVCASALMVVLHALLTPSFGLAGAACAVLAVLLMEAAWLSAIVARRLGLSPAIVDLRPVFGGGRSQ